MNDIRPWWMTAFFTILLGRGPSPADEPKVPGPAAQVSELARLFTSRCEFAVEQPSSRLLTRHPLPILRWSNPVAGEVFGDVYLWTDRGRPAVAVSYYKFFQPDWGRTLEVSSLTSEQIAGREGDTTYWSPEHSGLIWSPLLDVVPPADTVGARLVQLRRLAAEFRVELADQRNTDRGVVRQLRQLTQPVYRYPPPISEAAYVDGALFAFVEGTDPEVWLLLEAIASGKQLAWQFGLARMNRDALVVKHRDRVIWQTEHLVQVLDRAREPYAVFVLEQPLQSSSAKSTVKNP